MMQHRQQLLEAAKANIKKQQERQKELYDRKHARPNAFAVGERVLKKDFTRKKRRGGKMDHRYQGPLVITKNLGKGFYRLQDVEDPGVVIEKISGAHLKPYKDPDQDPVSKADEFLHCGNCSAWCACSLQFLDYRNLYVEQFINEHIVCQAT